MENKAIKILAIDDIFDNLIAIQALVLESFPNAKVILALNGQEGLELAANENPDVILLDIVMPEMDGYEICKRLKADKNLCDIPVVFVTALKGEKASRIRCLEVGAEAFLAKPIDETELVAQIRAMVKIKETNVRRHNENVYLAKLVEERTIQLNNTHKATLNLLEDLKKENKERRKTEEALRESEEKYRDLMENSPQGIMVYVEGQIAYINKAALRLMRANHKDELMGKSIIDFIHLKNQELVLERMKVVAMVPVNSILPSVEEKYIRLDGTEVDVEIIVMPILFEGKPAVQILGHDISDRKKAELALEKSRLELKAIYDNAPVMMCVVDEDGRIQFANKAFTLYTGFSDELLKGKVLGGIIGCINAYDDPGGCGYGSKCDSCTLRKAMEDTHRTGIGQNNIEYHTTLKNNNNEIYLLGSTALIESNNNLNVLLCLHDITGRKHAEEALQKSETLLRTFIDNSPFEIWARNINSVGILENKILVDNYGSILGQTPTLDDRIDEKTFQQWQRINERAFGGEIIDEEFEFGINGENKNVQQIVFPINNNEILIGIAGFNIDITQRKEVEKELAEQKRFFEQVFMQSSLSMQILDKDGWCERINSKFTTIFGVEPKNIEGKIYNIFQDKEIIRKGINSKLDKVFKERKSLEWEVFFDIGVAANSQNIEVNDKKKVWYSNWAYPILDQNNEISHVIIQHSDITDRKEAEKALSESQEQLKKFAAHLQNIREDERSLLARDIHDDLGQILIAMKIDLGLLKQKVMKVIPDDESETFEIKFNELYVLVDSTLKSARRIMTDLRPEVLDLLGFVETVNQHLKSYSERNKITCNFVNNSEGLSLDSQQSVALYRIVQEALNNTSKYAKATEVTVRLDYLGTKLVLEIMDNGVGFDPKDKKHSDSYGLLGMEERVFLLEGELTITSQKGKGTVIKVVMPQKQWVSENILKFD